MGSTLPRGPGWGGSQSRGRRLPWCVNRHVRFWQAVEVNAPNVCVYCGSSSGRRPEHGRLAENVGRSIAARGVGLVYGGGRIGLMGIVADAVLDAGGRVHGVIPGHLVDLETAHSDLSSLDVVASMHERKSRMADLSTGFIVLPGGFGTFDELFEMLTWNQLGLVAKPVVFLDPPVEGSRFFDPLFAAFEHMMDEGFVSGSTRQMLQRSESADDAVERALKPAPAVDGKLRTLDVTSKRSLR